MDLEASFNFDHSLDNYSEMEDFVVSYREADSIQIAIAEYESAITVGSSDLFQTYHQLLESYQGMTNIGPMSDLEIFNTDPDIGTLRIRVAILGPANHVYPPSHQSYNDYHLSYWVNGNIKSTFWVGNAQSCGGNVGDNSWQILEHNLFVDYIWALSGDPKYFHSIINFSYGNDPFHQNSYIGPSQQDYSLAIYGANPDLVNTNSFADGYYWQCITTTQMQNLENSMGDILDDHINLNSNTSVLSIKVIPHENDYYHPTDPQIFYTRWTHHEFKFTTGIKNP